MWRATKGDSCPQRREAAGRASRRARQRPPPMRATATRARRPLPKSLPHSSCRRRVALRQNKLKQVKAASKQACRPLRPLYPTLLVIRVFVGACLGTCVVSTNHLRLTIRIGSLLALATSLRRARRSLSLTTLCVETGVLTCVLTVYLRVSTQKYAKAIGMYVVLSRCHGRSYTYFVKL